MASLTITVPDPQVSRVVAAFRAKFSNVVDPALSDANFMRGVLAYIAKAIVRDYEINNAEVAAAGTVTDIGAS